MFMIIVDSQMLLNKSIFTSIAPYITLVICPVFGARRTMSAVQKAFLVEWCITCIAVYYILPLQTIVKRSYQDNMMEYFEGKVINKMLRVLRY